MKNYLILAVLLILVAGCGSPKGTPVEYAKACDAANDGKHIETSGFLDDKGGVFCSNTSGRMECGFKLKENPSAEKGFTADIEIGSGANTVEKLEKGYKREDIKIRDHQGNVINLADKVKITGKLSTQPETNVCFVQVTKIEKS